MPKKEQFDEYPIGPDAELNAAGERAEERLHMQNLVTSYAESEAALEHRKAAQLAVVKDLEHKYGSDNPHVKFGRAIVEDTDQELAKLRRKRDKDLALWAQLCGGGGHA